MSKKVFLSCIVLLALTGSVVFAGCSTAQSRKRDQRIEELERRVAKIEFDNYDGHPSGDDFSRHREMARAAR
jgi:hypothetical protein